MKSSNIFTKKPLVVAVSGVLAGTSPVVMAQSADDGADVLEEILVTASRREQRIEDIPYNISAVDGNDIEDQNMVDTAELMRTISGVSVIDRGYRNAGHVNSLIIRGVNVDNGVNGDIPLSAAATVATYVDNTPLFANFLLKDIERVEVMRGPQGTLYGSSALGGTVRYIMRRPDASEFDASVGLTYGQTEHSDGNNVSIDGMVNIPLSDTAAFRLSAGSVENDGVVDYVNLYQLDGGKPVVLNNSGQCVGLDDTSLTNTELLQNGSCYTSKKDADDVSIKYARASLRFQPSDTFDIQLNYQWQEDEVGARRTITEGADFFGDAYNGKDQSGSTMLEPSDREATLTSLDLEWDLGFATLTSSTSSYEHQGNGWRDNSSLWVTGRDWFYYLYTGMPRPVAHVEAGFDEEAFVQEVRLVSNDSDSNVDWTVGAYYMDQEREVTNFSYVLGLDEYQSACFNDPVTCEAGGQWWVIGLPLSENDFYYRRQETFTDLALYGEVTWHATDDLHITGGLRWFDNELKNRSALDFPLFEGVVVPFNDFPTQTEDDIQFKVNVAYDLSDSSMVYGTISEGFRRGGSNAIPTTGFFAEPEPQSVEQYKADTVRNYEIGIKGASDRIRYSADAYYIDWQDPQLNTATQVWAFFMAQNGGSAETKGIEAEAHFLLSDSLELSLGFGHSKAELSSNLYQPQILAADPDDPNAALLAPKGHRLPGTAENTATAALQHSMDMANGLSLSTRLSAYYQSDSINSVTDTTIQDKFSGFSLWNFQTTLSSENWSAALFVKNIGDEQAVTGNYPAAYMSTDTSIFENYYGNNQRQYIATPRTIGVALKYNF